MQFLWSPVLWLLALVPLFGAVYVWFQTRRRKYALRYASLALVRPAVDPRARWRRYLPPALFFLALALMLVALARPVALIRTPCQEGIVILALDSSLSMRNQDMQPNRFEAALRAGHTFIEKRAPGAQVGIVAFAGNAAILQLPTDDEEDLHAALNRLFLQRGAAIGSGILTSLEAIALAQQGKPAASNSSTEPLPSPTLAPVPPGTVIPAIVILLTDGQNRNGPDPIESAQTALASGVCASTRSASARAIRSMRRIHLAAEIPDAVLAAAAFAPSWTKTHCAQLQMPPAANIITPRTKPSWKRSTPTWA
ncbi:MAG: VWA domain-containing protein [Chloroflexi bacterium]|nr:VWA domain-containing protein [Chloroflexota bacterium]